MGPVSSARARTTACGDFAVHDGDAEGSALALQRDAVVVRAKFGLPGGVEEDAEGRAVGAHAEHPWVRLVEALAAVLAVGEVVGVPEGNGPPVAPQRAGDFARAVEARSRRNGQRRAALAAAQGKRGNQFPVHRERTPHYRRRGERQGRRLGRIVAAGNKQGDALADLRLAGGGRWRPVVGARERGERQKHQKTGGKGQDREKAEREKGGFMGVELFRILSDSGTGIGNMDRAASVRDGGGSFPLTEIGSSSSSFPSCTWERTCPRSCALQASAWQTGNGERALGEAELRIQVRSQTQFGKEERGGGARMIAAQYIFTLRVRSQAQLGNEEQNPSKNGTGAPDGVLPLTPARRHPPIFFRAISGKSVASEIGPPERHAQIGRCNGHGRRK